MRIESHSLFAAKSSGDEMRRQVFILVTLWAITAAIAPVGAHPCLCNGDANLDGVFDEQDFWFTLECLGQLPIDVCSNADINCDGSIDVDDVNPDDPFSGDTAIVCLDSGIAPEKCCPNHVPCGSSTAGSCFEANSTAACNDLACCIEVCLSDPFCCDTFWDQFCAMAAKADCALPGDCDGDGGVDLDDYVTLTSCVTGPANEGLLAEGCRCVDFDGDDDCDLLDFSAFQLARVGSR